MLADLQDHFRRHAFGDTSAVLRGAVSASHGTVDRRLGVYRNNTIASLVKALAAVFPVCERIVGDTFFTAVARSYIHRTPPEKPQLHKYGSTFSEFLSTVPPVIEQVPYLPDVAQLEWARSSSFFSPDVPALPAEQLMTVEPRETGNLIFETHPSAWLIDSSYPVDRIWSVNQPDAGPIPKIDFSVAEAVLITRPADFIQQQVLEPGMAAFIDALMEQHPLEVAAEQGTEADPAFDLENSLASALQLGVFSDCRISK